MPTYPMICLDVKCGNKFDIICSVAQHEAGVSCTCGSLARRDWTAPLCLAVDQTLGYYDHGLGCQINSTSHRNKVMKSMGVEALTGSRSAKEQLGGNREVKKQLEASKKTKILSKVMNKELVNHRG